MGRPGTARSVEALERYDVRSAAGGHHRDDLEPVQLGLGDTRGGRGRPACSACMDGQWAHPQCRGRRPGRSPWTTPTPSTASVALVSSMRSVSLSLSSPLWAEAFYIPPSPLVVGDATIPNAHMGPARRPRLASALPSTRQCWRPAPRPSSQLSAHGTSQQPFSTTGWLPTMPPHQRLRARLDFMSSHRLIARRNALLCRLGAGLLISWLGIWAMHGKSLEASQSALMDRGPSGSHHRDYRASSDPPRFVARVVPAARTAATLHTSRRPCSSDRMCAALRSCVSSLARRLAQRTSHTKARACAMWRRPVGQGEAVAPRGAPHHGVDGAQLPRGPRRCGVVDAERPPRSGERRALPATVSRCYFLFVSYRIVVF